MTHRALIASLALGVALAACEKKQEPSATLAKAPGPSVAQMPPAAPSGPKPDYVCKKNGNCEVGVTIKDCSPDGIVLDHPSVGVERGNTDIDITWTIATADYEFSTEGVKFKESQWEKEFKDGTANKNKYTWHDLNPQGPQQNRAFPYTVTIVKKGGAACASKDPTVINDV
jgi:hypothetical protein